jgi:hypothetical protein
VTRTPHQYRESFTPSNVNHSSRTGRHIYKLPVSRRQRAADDESRDHILAYVTEQIVDLRVDWDGDPSSLGHFEVRVGDQTWQACELIDPSDTGIDVISPSQNMTGTTFRARFQRGPTYGSYSFHVKAVPIVWTPAPTAPLPRSYVAERGKDYAYAGGVDPESLPWHYSESSGGVHKVTLELSMTTHYEMWVRLQDPKGLNEWRIQDPILTPVSGGGNPNLR